MSMALMAAPSSAAELKVPSSWRAKWPSGELARACRVRAAERASVVNTMRLTPPGERSSDQVTEARRARVAAANRQASTGQEADDHSQSSAAKAKASTTRNW